MGPRAEEEEDDAEAVPDDAAESDDAEVEVVNDDEGFLCGGCRLITNDDDAPAVGLQGREVVGLESYDEADDSPGVGGRDAISLGGSGLARAGRRRGCAPTRSLKRGISLNVKLQVFG